MNELIERLRNKFPVKDEIYQKDALSFLTTEKSQAIELVTHLRDYEGYTHLISYESVSIPD